MNFPTPSCRSALALITAVTLCFTSAVSAQVYPTKPVRIVSPYPAGGATDVLARLLALRLQERLGQPVLVENRAGANGNLGSDYVAKATSDGHTLLLAAAGPLVISPALYPKLGYDPVKDFTAIAPIGQVPFLLLAHPTAGAATVADLIRQVKDKPGIPYASSGNGSPNHIIGEMFKLAAGVQLVHVPYKGSAPALNDLVAGHVPYSFDSPVGAMPHIQSGRLRALAVTSPKRSVALPSVPTLAEAGLARFESAVPWYGLFGPAGMPRTVVDRLHREVQAWLEQPEVRERLATLAVEPLPLDPEAFQKFVGTERDKWGRAVKQSGATVD